MNKKYINQEVEVSRI